MAEMAIWNGGEEASEGGSDTRSRLVSVLERLRARWNKVKGGSLEDVDRVHRVLEGLVGMMEVGGSQGDEAASEFGRMGGHRYVINQPTCIHELKHASQCTSKYTQEKCTFTCITSKERERGRKSHG